MKKTLGNRLRELLGLAFLTKGHPAGMVGSSGGPPGWDDSGDIERTVETFRQLISRVSLDGHQLSDLYVRAERRAAEFERLSETVLESVTSGIMVLEANGTVRLANSAAKEILAAAAGADLAGSGLGQLFLDSGELESLMRTNFETGKNSSRKVLTVVTADGTKRKLGASTTCVRSSPEVVDAVIVVFTQLPGGEGVAGAEALQANVDLERQSYLRGVMDSYDLLSGLAGDFNRIEAKSKTGKLTTSELSEFSSCLKRSCDLMMVLALSRGAADSIPELVDANSVVESVLMRGNHLEGPLLTKHLCRNLPQIKTLRKTLETGLGLLIAGCLGQSKEGIEVGTTFSREAGGAAVTISVKERGPTRSLRNVGYSLRGLAGEKDMYREAGLFLLSSLPSDGYRLVADRQGGFFHFRARFLAPIDSETGSSRQMGDFRDRNKDEE